MPDAKILSYNFFQRPPLIRNNGTSDYKDLRLELFIRYYLPHFDIICLQEMFAYGSCRLRRLLSAAQRAGLTYHISSPVKSLFWDAAIDGGLLILSRFPLLNCQSETFPRGIIADQ